MEGKNKNKRSGRCGVRTSVIPDASVCSGGEGFPLFYWEGEPRLAIASCIGDAPRLPITAAKVNGEYVNGSITPRLSSISRFIPLTKGMFRPLVRSKRALAGGRGGRRLPRRWWR